MPQRGIASAQGKAGRNALESESLLFGRRVNPCETANPPSVVACSSLSDWLHLRVQPFFAGNCAGMGLSRSVNSQPGYENQCDRFFVDGCKISAYGLLNSSASPTGSEKNTSETRAFGSLFFIRSDHTREAQRRGLV